MLELCFAPPFLVLVFLSSSEVSTLGLHCPRMYCEKCEKSNSVMSLSPVCFGGDTSSRETHEQCKEIDNGNGGE